MPHVSTTPILPPNFRTGQPHTRGIRSRFSHFAASTGSPGRRCHNCTSAANCAVHSQYLPQSVQETITRFDEVPRGSVIRPASVRDVPDHGPRSLRSGATL